MPSVGRHLLLLAPTDAGRSQPCLLLGGRVTPCGSGGGGDVENWTFKII